MKIVIRILLVLLIVGGVAVVVLKQNAIATARAEHQALMNDGDEARKLTLENKGIFGLRGTNGETEKLREENKDLPKLRNEVRQLRRQAEDLAKLRQENERLRSSQKDGGVPKEAGFIPRTALVDAGFSTPEAALQTSFFAITKGDFERMKECLTPEMREQMAKQGEEKARTELAEMGKSIPGYRIVDREEVSETEVKLHIEMIEGDQTPIGLKKIGNEWKISR